MATMMRVLEKQVGLWELKRRLEDLGDRAGRYLEGHRAYGPFLLVSRERGSGGCQVARWVGERLGWSVFDREIVDQIAQRAHVMQQLVATVDPETRASWEESWQPALEPKDMSYENYLRGLRQVVLALGHHGDVVILGRGAQYLLPTRCGLRVRFVAPFEQRVRRIAELEKRPVADVQAWLPKLDADQADFIRRCFQHDLNSPFDYDLLINTGEIGLGPAVELVLAALRAKLSARLQKG